MYSYELREKLFGKNLTYNEATAIDHTIAAYADSHHGLNEIRNLHFFCPNPVDGAIAILISEKCIISYNAFNRKMMERVVKVFGDNSDYFFAREGSVCVYVKTYKRNWIEDLNQLKIDAEIDEISYEPKLGLFRLWWD